MAHPRWRRNRKQIVAERQAELEAERLVDQLMRHPSFNVLSVDRTCWVHPYTGRLISAVFDYREVARRVLIAEKPWRTGKPKSPQMLNAIRWLHFLHQHVRTDARLRIFQQPDRWLNPFTAEWVRGVRPVGGQLSSSTIQEMARILAACPQAQSGQMLPASQLQAKLTEYRRAAAAEQITRRAAKPAHPVAVPTSRTSRPAQPTPPVAHPVRPSRPEPVELDMHEIEVEVEPDFTKRLDLLFDPDRQDQAQAWSQMVDEVARGGADAALEALDPQVATLLARHRLSLAIHGAATELAGGTFHAVLATRLDQILLVMGEIGGREETSARLLPILLRELPDLVVKHPRFTEALQELNGVVLEDFPPDKLVKLWVGCIDPEERTIQCANAGHEPAIVVTPDGDPIARPLGAPGPLLGRMDSDRFIEQVEPVVYPLNEPSALLVYTAEICDVVDRGGHPIGRLDLWGRFLSLADRDPQTITRSLVEEVEAATQRTFREVAPASRMMVLRAY